MFVFQLFNEAWQEPIYAPSRSELDECINAILKVVPEVGEWDTGVQRYVASIPAGMEIEVENAFNVKDKKYQWDIAIDGSLRGLNALEYKTPRGVTVGQIAQFVANLHGQVEAARKKKPEAWQFSERTSVHVHLDVRAFTVEQLANLIQLYILFEDALFGFAGPVRKYNIFCIPFSASDYNNANQSLRSIVQRAEKYCAFNLGAVKQFGTVEFRHMEGNLDPRKMFVWLMLLGRLHWMARTMTREDVFDLLVSLKGESQYQVFAERLFGFSLSRVLQLDANRLDAAVSESKFFSHVEA